MKIKFMRVFERQIIVEIRKKNIPNIHAILGGMHSIIRDGHDLYTSEKQELLYITWQELYAKACPVIKQKHMKDLQSALSTISSVGAQIQGLYRKMAHAEQRNLSRSVELLQNQINDKMMELEELEHTQTAIIRSNLDALVELMEIMKGFEESGIDTYKLSGFTSRDLYYDLRRLDNRY